MRLCSTRLVGHISSTARAWAKRHCHRTSRVRRSASNAASSTSVELSLPTTLVRARLGRMRRTPLSCTVQAALPLVDWPSCNPTLAAKPSVTSRSALRSRASRTNMDQTVPTRAQDVWLPSGPASSTKPCTTARAAAERLSSSALVIPDARTNTVSRSRMSTRRACSRCSLPVAPVHCRVAWLVIHSAMPKRCTVPSAGSAASASTKVTTSFQRAKLPSSWDPAKPSSHSTTLRLARATRVNL
mmetsp:Transcript_58757/g.184435  ORF Transcript_58757/g.184435 Transcript_58757/m.184435 type:complete len:243 (-) Transcript_58757:1209-1937(-)